MAIVKISLQGTKAPEIYDTLRALLQTTDLRIQNSEYFLTCLSPWCNITNYVMPTLSETPSESNCNAEIYIFCFLIILLLLIIVVSIKCYSKRSQSHLDMQAYCFNDTTQSTTKDKQVHYLNLKQTV